MEQIKDIFKQVRQAKGSLAFCKEEIINDTLYALADRVEAATDRILEENAKDLAAMDPSNPKYDRLKLTAPDRASQWHEADQGKCAFRGDRHYL